MHFDRFSISEMYQQNVRFKTKREVRRRPCFLSGQDVEAKLKRYSRPLVTILHDSTVGLCNVNVLPHLNSCSSSVPVIALRLERNPSLRLVFHVFLQNIIRIFTDRILLKIVQV